jgi:AraC-like DNA-binding protein
LGPEAGTLQAAAQGRFLELLEGIVEAPRRTAREDLWRPIRRARFSLALAALDEIHRHGAHHVRLADIVARLGVSNRALEKALRSVVGVSPGQYLLACRLNRARERLNAGSGRVLDSALDAGFSDQSRFALQYRRLFGELPS